MFHPFEGDLSSLKDSEIENKISELSRKFYQAQRLGKPELLTQISTFITIYKDEMSKRYYKNIKADGDLDQLINVD